MPTRLSLVSLVTLAMLAVATLTGCHAIDFYTPALQAQATVEMEPPRELSKVSLPTYRIEPPDVLNLEVLRLVPRPPYRIETYDVLTIRVLGTILDQPIAGYYLVEGDGRVNLGPAYGSVVVEGMTTEEAILAIARHLRAVLNRPTIAIELARSAGAQQLSGAYPVQPDGTVNLRHFGMVHVTGKTVTEAKAALEQHLALYFDSPQVGVDVAKYNSQRYYVIVAGDEDGDKVRSFPISGNETVLDAIGRIEGLSRVSSKTMWVARPVPGRVGSEEVLPVDWDAIARGGVTDTNYQLLPRDRVYIVDDKLVAGDIFVAHITRPFFRLLSIASLSTESVRGMQTLGRNYNQFQ